MNRKNWIVLSGCLLGALLVCLVLMWTTDPDRKAARLARSDDPDDRIQAVEMLRGSGGDDARETLAALAKDKSLKVSLAAAAALGASQDESFVGPLRGLVAGAGDPKVRGRAAAGLGRYKSSTTDELVKLLRGDKDAPVRAGAAEGLSQKRDKAAIEPLLLAMADDPDLAVRKWAAEALYKTVGMRSFYNPNDSLPQRRAMVARFRSEVAKVEARIPR
ncbi:MAG TPA: HEAT repeat domain-containing protein [Phycisphaerae bacterium]|nr:HEAT repeat domain-containing protein [Phycisphaerae bacterium]